MTRGNGLNSQEGERPDNVIDFVTEEEDRILKKWFMVLDKLRRIADSLGASIGYVQTSESASKMENRLNELEELNKSFTEDVLRLEAFVKAVREKLKVDESASVFDEQEVMAVAIDDKLERGLYLQETVRGLLRELRGEQGSASQGACE